MKRFIYYLLLLAGIIGSSCVVLFLGDFMPQSLSGTTGADIMKNFINGIVKGNYQFGTSTTDFFTYGMTLFLLINVALVLAILLSWLISGFRLSKIKRFYSIAVWFFVSSMFITAFWVWLQIDTVPHFVFNDYLRLNVVPFAASLVLCLLGLVFSVFDRRKQ